jgi:hypothetical protein
LNFSGELGPEATNWFSDLVNLPEELRVRPPLSFSEAHLISERDIGISFQGNFALESGTSATLDIYYSPEELVIKKLLIRDEESHLIHTLKLDSKTLDFSFAGNLTSTTLNRMFVNNPFPNGSLEGDFRAQTLLDRPTQSTAKGKIMGKNLIFPGKLKEPLLIHSLDMDAAENEFTVHSVELTWGDRDISLTGYAVTSDKGLILDMDLSTNRLEWEKIANALKEREEDEEEKDTDETEDDSEWDLPIRGILRVRSDSFTFEGFTWNPLHADIYFDDDSVNVAVNEADLCGISTPGVLLITKKEVVVDFEPESRNQEMDITHNCLFGVKERITGTFDLTGVILGRGKGEELIRSMHGNLEISSQNGKIFEGGAMAKIVALLNVTEVYRGVLPNMRDQGFEYKSINYKCTIGEGKITIEEGIIDGKTMQIAGVGDIDFLEKKYDIKILVSPLKTVDTVLRLIPIVSGIFGGTLVTIPVKLTGDWDDPQVSFMPASAVGSGLLGILTNTLKAPVKLIDPLIPGGSDKEK